LQGQPPEIKATVHRLAYRLVRGHRGPSETMPDLTIKARTTQAHRITRAAARDRGYGPQVNLRATVY